MVFEHLRWTEQERVLAAAASAIFAIERGDIAGIQRLRRERLRWLALPLLQEAEVEAATEQFVQATQSRDLSPEVVPYRLAALAALGEWHGPLPSPPEVSEAADANRLTARLSRALRRD